MATDQGQREDAGFADSLPRPTKVRYVTLPDEKGSMALTNAERQRRYRDRRAAQEPVIKYRRPQDRASRPSRWMEAIETLRELHQDYCRWYDTMPESLQGTGTGEKLAAMAELDIDASTLGELAEMDLPRGFGRD